MDSERLEQMRAAQRRRRELEREIDRLTVLLRERPRSAALFYERATAHRLKGDLFLAVCDYNRALRLNPSHTEAHFYKAVVCAALGNRYEEIRAYRGFLAHARDLGQAMLDRVQRRLIELEQGSGSRTPVH
jgi:tetratricopeptide (TPR) repeat protein